MIIYHCPRCASELVSGPFRPQNWCPQCEEAIPAQELADAEEGFKDE